MAEFDIMYGHGISKAGDVLDCSVEAGLLEKSGAWYSYKGTRIGQGRENIKTYLKDNPDVLEELEKELIKQFLDKKSKSIEAKVDKIIVDEDGVIFED